MSIVLDAARRLAEADLAGQWEPDTDYLGCPWCYATISAASYSPFPVAAHAEDCVYLQLPAIVRALEAAERVANEWGRTFSEEGSRSPTHRLAGLGLTFHALNALEDALSGAVGGGEGTS